MGEQNVPRTLLISKNTLGSQSRILASILDPQTVISEPNSMIPQILITDLDMDVKICDLEKTISKPSVNRHAAVETHQHV